VDGGDGCVKPSTEAIQDGSYTPLARPLFMYPSEKALKRPEVKTLVMDLLASELVPRVRRQPGQPPAGGQRALGQRQRQRRDPDPQAKGGPGQARVQLEIAPPRQMDAIRPRLLHQAQQGVVPTAPGRTHVGG